MPDAVAGEGGRGPRMTAYEAAWWGWVLMLAVLACEALDAYGRVRP